MNWTLACIVFVMLMIWLIIELDYGGGDPRK